ncbi:hypothetical protein B0H14DRAFT_3520458 [Mycena olivaceomarginata]|nr:hypothetical protein B0H14DRAFT_3520458 [Mycena olivaceomarginata]
MPPRSRTTVDKILEYTKAAADALQDVANATQVPFLTRVCTLSLAIVSMMQNTKLQKDRCLQIVEEIHHLLCALMHLSIRSEDIQSPTMLNHVAQFAV